MEEWGGSDIVVLIRWGKWNGLTAAGGTRGGLGGGLPGGATLGRGRHILR